MYFGLRAYPALESLRVHSKGYMMPENLKRLTDKDWGCGGCLISAVMFITVACIMSITISSILEHWLRHRSATGAASCITMLLTPVNIYICYLLWQIYYRLYGQPPFGYHRDNCTMAIDYSVADAFRKD